MREDYPSSDDKELTLSSTGIHWHGIRQLNNNINDGAPGVTECPIAPGHNKTYTFNATQYGSSWYHTHVSSQYAYGITGSIHIDGPASLNYDIDLGPFPISDWYYGSADQILLQVSDARHPFVAGSPGSSPPSDNLLFNGTNINPVGGGGNYARVNLTPGKRHRLRLINPSVDNTYTVSIVNHEFTVIETDFVPVNAYSTNSIFVGVGQRYDVLIDANQPSGNYWINATYSNTKACGSSRNPFPAAILHYDSAPEALPTIPGTQPQDSLCADNTQFVPIVTRTAPLALFTPQPSNTLPVSLEVDPKISRVFWQVNASAIDISWDNPTLESLLDGNHTFPGSDNIVNIPGTSEVCNQSTVHTSDFIYASTSPLTNACSGAFGSSRTSRRSPIRCTYM